MNLQELYAARKRTVTVVFEGMEMALGYKPLAHTPAMFGRVKAAQDALNFRLAHEEILLALVSEWDLLGEDGTALVISAETLAMLPLEFLTAMTKAITDDLKAPDKEEKKD